MEIASHFKLIFLTVVALTVLSLIGIGALAMFGSEATDSANISIMQKNFSVACSFGWQSGIGAIFGLLGGKATSESERPWR